MKRQPVSMVCTLLVVNLPLLAASDEVYAHLPPAYESSPKAANTIRPGDVVFTTLLGGLLKSYSRRAA